MGRQYCGLTGQKRELSSWGVYSPTSARRGRAGSTAVSKSRSPGLWFANDVRRPTFLAKSGSPGKRDWLKECCSRQSMLGYTRHGSWLMKSIVGKQLCWRWLEQEVKQHAFNLRCSGGSFAGCIAKTGAAAGKKDYVRLLLSLCQNRIGISSLNFPSRHQPYKFKSQGKRI